MKRTILFVQGGGEGAYETDEKLVSYLQHTLDERYKILFPKMPGEDDPNYEKYKEEMESAINKVNGHLILIGHSVGACFLLKYISENKIDKTICGLFLIATPFWGKGGWSYEGFHINNELASVKTINIPVFFYHGTADEIVPFPHLSLYAKTFPHATIRIMEGRNHQMGNNLSEVVQDIEAIE